MQNDFSDSDVGVGVVGGEWDGVVVMDGSGSEGRRIRELIRGEGRKSE